MSDDYEAPKKNKFADALKNGPGTISTRMIILTVLPALLGFSIWSGERIVAKIDEMGHEVEANHSELLQVTGDLKSRVTGVEHDVLAIRDRMKP